MSRSSIATSCQLFCAFACVALVEGCALEEASEEAVPAEYAVVASEAEDEEGAAEPEPDAFAPFRRFVLPPNLERSRETEGPFPQPWTPPNSKGSK